jgi:hypothetical protein
MTGLETRPRREFPHLGQNESFLSRFPKQFRNMSIESIGNELNHSKYLELPNAFKSIFLVLAVVERVVEKNHDVSVRYQYILESLLRLE